MPSMDIRAIALDGKCLRTKCEENHDLGYEVLKRFAQIMEQRLEATRLQLLDVYAVSTMSTAIATSRSRSDAPHPYCVRDVAKETPDTFTLTLEPENGDRRQVRLQPGQFSMLWVFGVGELPISISGDPAKHRPIWCTPSLRRQATHALVSQKRRRQRRRARPVRDRLAG